MNVSRRAVLLAGSGCLVSTGMAEATALAIARELRRMVGFQVLAADDVRQAWRDRGVRYIELRASGLFKQVNSAGLLDPPGFTETIVFVKPRTRDYRLLIDGEFYQVVPHD